MFGVMAAHPYSTYAATPVSRGGTALVTNTDGDTIRVRDGAGTSYDQVAEAHEGETVSILDGPAKVSGRARYVGDFGQPGMLHVAVARAAEPHARLVRVEVGPAAERPGVVAVFTGADLEQGHSLCSSRRNSHRGKHRRRYHPSA